MNVTGIIAEYNPFHTGHAYHIREARMQTGADFIIVSMSGDFVQRGGPALFDKYTRTRMALSGGADLVLELPAAFSCSSAEDFAACGTALLDRLGVVNCLCFGSEHGHTEDFMDGASFLLQEDREYSLWLQEELKRGATFPAARQTALKKVYGENSPAALSSLVSSPNNILGLEYCKAVLRQNAALRPLTISRKGDGYHDAISHTEFASATGIRAALFKEFPYGLPAGCDTASFSALTFLPDSVKELFCLSKPLWPEDFSSLLNGKILDMAQQKDRGVYRFGQISDISTDMALRLSRLSLNITGWEGRIRQLKTRQYTYTRINRGLTRLLLNITEEQTACWKAQGYAPYARVLGFKKQAVPLLSAIKKSSRIPLITKPSAAFSVLSGPALDEFQKDLYASHLYQSAFCQRYPSARSQTPGDESAGLKNEFNRKLMVLE